MKQQEIPLHKADKKWWRKDTYQQKPLSKFERESMNAIHKECSRDWAGV